VVPGTNRPRQADRLHVEVELPLLVANTWCQAPNFERAYHPAMEREQPRPETDEGAGEQDPGCDERLDDALEGTFPASDPISPEDPGR
jgi:hypothetical protein